MPAKSITLHVRIAPSLFERLKAQAERNRRPIASMAALILDDHVEPFGSFRRPDTAPDEAPGQASAYVATNRDAVHALIVEALAERGATDACGLRKVALADVRRMFAASRPDRAQATIQSGFPKALKRLLDGGRICRDATHVWLADQRV